MWQYSRNVVSVEGKPLLSLYKLATGFSWYMLTFYKCWFFPTVISVA